MERGKKALALGTMKINIFEWVMDHEEGEKQDRMTSERISIRLLL